MENSWLAVASEWIWPFLGLMGIPLLVATNGLFVAAEFALVAVRRTRIEEMMHRGQKGAKAVESATVNLDRSIAATQLGITLASIGLGWSGEPAMARILERALDFLPLSPRAVASHTLATAIAFLIITFMHVVFGELIPKTIALQKPDGTALWVARSLNIFAHVTRPLIYVMNGTGNYILRLCGFQAASGREMVHSIEELSLLIEDTEEAGVLGETQAEVVQKVFRLSGKRVRDCMVPRDKMDSLELSAPPDKVLEAVRSGAHTRMPVYRGEMNSVVGIVNTKDLFFLFSVRGAVILEDAIYPAVFLRPEEDVACALEQLRKAHRQMALIRDANGDVLGLLTLEDILEEIVGEIEDEHDDRAPARFARTAAREPRPDDLPGRAPLGKRP